MIVSLSVPTLMKVLGMVQSGTFRSLDDAIEAALKSCDGRGLPSHESRETEEQFEKDRTPIEPARNPPRPRKFMPSLVGLDASHIRFAEPLDRSMLTSELMPITFQKFLPMKVALVEAVVYMKDLQNDEVLLRKLWAHVGIQAVSWGVALEEIDDLLKRTRGERLSVSFPKRDDTSGKSMIRYLDSAFGRPQQNGRQSGVIPFLGFGTLATVDNEASFGITKDGYDFATLRNPVLTDGEYAFPPFSIQEREFLLNQISKRCPTEAEHMRYYLDVLRRHPGISRTEANRYMRGFYERIWNPVELTSSLVDSLRGGVNSRCSELGLTKTTREGINAYYAATDIGNQWLGGTEKTE